MHQKRGKKTIYYKLSPRFYGPFKVTTTINDAIVRLELPLHWKMHNAFHVSLLKKFTDVVPTEPVAQDPPELEELEQILVPD